MTVAVIWREGGFQWCVTDTRLVAGERDRTTSEIAVKIHSIPMSIRAIDGEGAFRAPHYWTQYGFAFAGAALPATETAATASTLLQLARPGDRANPPPFDEVAGLVSRLAKRFMNERSHFGADGIFSAAFFGWCPYLQEFRLAHIEGTSVGGRPKVALSFPQPPTQDGEPWLVLGSGKSLFLKSFASLKAVSTKEDEFLPKRAVEKMIAGGTDATVGGAASVGAAFRQGFQLFFAHEENGITVHRQFNGLDLDSEVGEIRGYQFGINQFPTGLNMLEVDREASVSCAGLPAGSGERAPPLAPRFCRRAKVHLESLLSG